MLAIGALTSVLPSGVGQHIVTVVLDPGHGGEQQGAIGICGIAEKDVTLSVAQRTELILRESGAGIEVILSRTSDYDVPLSERPALANRMKAALFVSIHANASPRSTTHGMETYVLSDRAQDFRSLALVRRENGAAHVNSGATSLTGMLSSLRLDAAHGRARIFAENIQKQLSESVSARDRGVLAAPFAVLHGAQAPAILLELGFLSNSVECAALASLEHQDTLAQGIAAGILAELAHQARLEAGRQ